MMSSLRDDNSYSLLCSHYDYRENARTENYRDLDREQGETRPVYQQDLGIDDYDSDCDDSMLFLHDKRFFGGIGTSGPSSPAYLSLRNHDQRHEKQQAQDQMLCGEMARARISMPGGTTYRRADVPKMIKVEIPDYLIRRHVYIPRAKAEEAYPVDFFKHKDHPCKIMVSYSDKTIRDKRGNYLYIDHHSVTKDPDKIVQDKECKVARRLFEEKDFRMKMRSMIPLVTSRECLDSYPGDLQKAKKYIIDHKDHPYSLLFYSVNIQNNKVYSFDHYGISQNAIRINKKNDKIGIFEKICVPMGIKNKNYVPLSARIKYVVDNIENLFPDLGEGRPDINLNAGSAITHAIFIPLEEFDKMMQYDRISVDKSLPFCSAVMRGERHDCLAFDLIRDLEALRDISRSI